MEEFENDEAKITKGVSKEVMTSKVKGETTNGGVSREIIKPRVVEGFVQKIVMKKYGLRVVNVEELDGYYDRNYHIKVDSNHKHPSLGSLHEHGYLLKIHNSTESSVPEILDEQHMLLEHLLKNSINTQEVIPNLAGDMYSLECCHEELRGQDKHENNACAVELRTYIPGRLIKDVPYSVGLMIEVGRLVANVTNVFQSLRSPDYNGRELGQWSLISIPKLKRFTFCLQDGQRSHINTVIDSFSERVATKYLEMPKGYIHGDLNESNILVSQNHGDEEYHMSGVLDVGDAEYSCPVFDLAVNLTYMMLDSEMVDQLDTPGYILSGYLSVRSLTSTEWQVLVPCMAGRLAQSLTLGAYSRYLQQGSDHNSTAGAKTWSLLTEFCAQPEETLLHRWKSIVDTCYVKFF